jgi:hypothetical protein
MIEFTGDVHEFSMNTAYFTVTPQDFIAVSETDLSWWIEWIPNRIRDELKKVGGGIIWWRIKPEIEHVKIGWSGFYEGKDPKLMTAEEKELAEKYFCWKGYVRFATSPELHEDVLIGLFETHEVVIEKIAELRAKAKAM